MNLKSRDVGSSNPTLNRNHLHLLPVSVPLNDNQQAIAAVLSSLDDKIDLLHRQNKTLEAVAQTLFRQWFVEEADEGWEKGTIEDLFILQRGFDLPATSRLPGNVPVAICYANWRSSKATDKLVSQFKLNNQPCLVKKKISASGTEKFTKTRRQLHVNVELENIGDYPALHVVLLGYIKLKYTQYRGADIVKMDHLPDFIQYIPKDGSRRLGIRFETSEINALVEDLKVAFDLNIERLSANPYKKAYEGSDLVLTVFYKNLLGQWFEIEIVQIINWLENISKHKPAQTTNNRNENTIPPKHLNSVVKLKRMC